MKTHLKLLSLKFLSCKGISGVSLSVQDTRVSPINVDMVSRLISVVGCGLILWLDEVGGKW
jgi:hypothetical protein